MQLYALYSVQELTDLFMHGKIHVYSCNNHKSRFLPYRPTQVIIRTLHNNTVGVLFVKWYLKATTVRDYVIISTVNNI